MNPTSPLAVRLGILIGLGLVALDFVIARWVWRALRRGASVRFDGRGPRAAMPPPLPRPLYSLPARRNLGCLAVVAILLAVMFLTFIALIVPYAQRARASREATAQAVVRADVYSDSGSSGDSHTYRFELHSPVNSKTTVWAEIWRDGKTELTPGFALTRWVIPPSGAAFNGSATFKLTAPKDGKVQVEWQLAGDSGANASSGVIEDPLAGMPLRDSTWGIWTGEWAVPIGQPVQMMCLRGARRELPGSPADETFIGKADGEIRLFARFDPLTAQEAWGEQRRAAVFGESAMPPARGSSATTQPSQPSTLPNSGTPPPDAEPPAIRGTSAEGLVR